MKIPIPVCMMVMSLMMTTASDAREMYTTVGVTFLGTGFLSFSIERRFGDNSVRTNIGFFDSPRELCLAVTANRYHDSGKWSPHIGAGLWTVLAITPKGIGHIDALTVPLGVDRDAGKGHSVGGEADASLFIGGHDPGGKPMRFRGDHRTMFLALPALSWKYRP